jgi:hypothetical protein
MRPLPPTQTVSTAPVASANTWIDNKGRVVQALFASLADDNLVLKVAGKNYPLPLSTLSPASQQIARDLAATQSISSPAETQWLEGRWLQVIPDDGGRLVDYLPGGVAMFMGGGNDGIASWALKGEVISVQWSSGTTETLRLVSPSETKSIEGDVVFKSGRNFAIHQKKLSGAEDAISPTSSDLEGKVFDSGWYSEADPSKSGLNLSTELRFLPGGRFKGETNANETRWEIKGGQLAFFYANGSQSTTFEKFYRLGNAWTMIGPFHGKPGITHILRERVAIPTPVRPSSSTGVSSNPSSSSGVAGSIDPSLLGLWYQHIDGNDHADGSNRAFQSLAFFADGTSGFGWEGKGMGIGTPWSIINDTLEVRWPSKCIYRIDLKSGTATELSGTATGGKPSYFTMKIRHTGLRPAKPADLPQPEDLTGLTFDFLYHESGHAERQGSNGLIRLSEGGKVEPRIRFGISNWHVSKGFLHFTNERNETQSMFNEFKKVAGKWRITGLYIPVADCIHTLKQE